jgi:hypothetical protein
MKAKFVTPVLIACTLFLSITNGTGLYEHMFGIPKMLSSPAALIEANNNAMGQPQKFWIPLHVMIMATLILSLILNWKSPSRKKLVRIVFISYIYISVISIFFARELFTFNELADGTEFYRQTRQWILLSWHRPIIGLAGVVLLMIAISKPSKPIDDKSY